MDYYLVGDGTDGVLVEEFVYGDDHSAVGLCGTIWRPGQRHWQGAASFSRALRTDPVLLARVAPVGRDRAGEVFHRLSGARLPDEAALRSGYFDYEPFPAVAPLRLGLSDRTYRVLFAKDLTASGAGLSGRLRVGGDVFDWEVRRVGLGIAWALDVTVELGADADGNVRLVLSELTEIMRRQGLIPITTERFA
ncbi:hypothetical protein [Actinoplanes sp. NPDC051851]|uniref:hypothetical protein n=1 Tax=Actinoplanes sp. NPDC051851 TaxID=3154753 RepID=UPI003449DBDF